jgi:PAS domain S-box-containing protein
MMPTNLDGTILQGDGQQYEKLMARIDGIVWEFDTRTFQFTFVSKQAERMLGYPLKQWLTPGFWIDHLHPDDRDWVLEFCLRATQEKRNHDFEYRMIAADGRTVWLHDIVSVFEEGDKPTKLCGIMVDITDRKRAEEESQTYLWFFESLDQVNRAIQGTNNLEQMMSNVLDALLTIFDCDRAWLVYPCDPEAASWKASMESTKLKYPGAYNLKLDVPMEPEVVKVFQTLRASSGPVRFGPGSEHTLPAGISRHFSIQSQIAMAIYPKVDKPYAFGLHQCSYSRVWKQEEERLFQEVGRRLADALTGLLMFRSLRESEARFRTFVDHATDAFFLHDDQGNILDVNQQACESLGYTREELIRMTPYEIDLDTDRSLMNQIGAKLDAGEVMAFDTHHTRKDGTVFPAEVRLRPFWEGGRRFGVSLARDITERKRAQEALQESEERFRMLSEASFEGIWIHEQGKILDLNRSMAAMFGYEPSALIGSNLLELAAPESRELILEKVQSGSEEPYEAVGVRKDGTKFYGEVIGRAIPWYGRKCQVTAIRDITRRKQAERALIESYSLLNAVFEGTSDAIFVKDRQGSYLMINSTGAQFLGLTVEEVIGKDDRELFSPETAFAIMDRDRQLMATGESLTIEETVTAAGVTRTYLTTKGVYRDTKGKVIGLIGISRDITELKRLEEQFRESQKMEAVGRLAGGVAHDFNNLLTVINGYSGLAFNRLKANDPSRRLLSEIQKAGERAANLTHQLLAFSRKQVLQPQVVSLNILLSELFKLLQRLLGEDIELALVLDPALGLAKVDPGQFEQTIINLAVNARDAMVKGGRLTIETYNIELDEDYAQSHPEVKPGRYVLVAVSDSGQGMDEATKARIFEPFFTTKALDKGTGLGLAIVYGFVKQSGGHIDVYSELELGTSFKVYLPRADDAVPSAKCPSESLKIHKGTETVLLVEDEDSLRSMLKFVLLSSGYTVLEAREGQEAIKVAEQYQGTIHLLVTDVVMPRMSGRQLADLLAKDRPEMRILYISGYTDEAVIRHGVLEASVAFLQKPFSPNNLARKVREALDTEKGCI